MEKRVCLFCNDTITGRIDKKFCTDQCRSNFKNQNRPDAEKVIVQVNKVLRKNRTILKTLNPAGFSLIRKEVLEQQGFNFRYFTSLYKTRDGNEYWFCYDIGYMFLDENKIRIVEYQKYMKVYS